jgi:hypothetical protein
MSKITPLGRRTRPKTFPTTSFDCHTFCGAIYSSFVCHKGSSDPAV